MRTWILPYIKLYKGRIILNILFAVLGIVSGAMLLFVSGFLISKTSLEPENILLVFVPIVAVRAFSIAQAVFPYLEKLTGHHVVLKILAYYRNTLYDIIEPQAFIFHSRYQTGDMLGLAADDIEKLQDFYIRTLFPAVSSVVVYAGIVAVFGAFDPVFMLLMMALLGIMVFLVPLFSYAMMRKRHKWIKQKRATLYQHVTDALFGQLDWIVSGRTTELFDHINQGNRALLYTEDSIHKWHHVRDIMLRILSGFSIIATMIWVTQQVDEGAMAATVIAAFILMMFSITEALMPASPAAEEIPSYTESITRMDQLPLGQTQKTENSEHEGPSAHPAIHLQDVSYQYDEGRAGLIEHVQTTFQPGEKVALLGKSGCGKSTLLKLIAGIFTPDSGDVKLDGAPMSKAHLSRKVSVLNQHPHLFHTTIANNIRIGREDATEEEIIQALQQAQMMDLINTLPDGIHTQMEEMGKRFSGGERHRIAFARLLIQNTPILLLDEPTTGLDPITEHALLSTMLEAAADKTIILVTHHLTGARLMDQLIFLENGEVKYAGNHSELMKTNNEYRKLYEMDTGMIG